MKFNEGDRVLYMLGEGVLLGTVDELDAWDQVLVYLVRWDDGEITWHTLDELAPTNN